MGPRFAGPVDQPGDAGAVVLEERLGCRIGVEHRPCTDKGSVSARIASMAGGSQGWASTPGSWGESQSAWKIDVLGPMSGEPAESDAGQSGGDPALLLVGL